MKRHRSAAVDVALLISLLTPLGSVPAHAQACGYVQECGDVISSSGVTVADALAVLRKAVGLSQALTCECSEDAGPCQSDLATCTDEVSTAQSELAACDGEKKTCTDGLESCDAQLAACDGDVEACGEGLEDCATSHEACSQDLSDATGGLATCAFDCATGVRGPLRTGQTNCYSDNSQTPCTGMGQDGELQLGATQKFIDNGDGTVSDDTTLLMWEKLSDDDSIHDKDATYSWEEALSVKVATLNETKFAGYSDWRLPNINELATIWNVGAIYPATFPAFNTACEQDCTVSTCSCTSDSQYVSSTTNSESRGSVWTMIYWFNGTPFNSGKSTPNRVRAVRGGA